LQEEEKTKSATALLFPKEFPDIEPGFQVKNLLSNAIPAKDFKINTTKNINKGLAAALQSEEEQTKLQTTISNNPNLNSKLTTKIPGKRNPSIIVYNLLNSTSEEDLFTVSTQLKIRFKFSGRTKSTSNWVLETPAVEFHTLTHKKQSIYHGRHANSKSFTI
ncbi:hypothetical protein AVEN_270633-1, partial [Araneus ventricosus]